MLRHAVECSSIPLLQANELRIDAAERDEVKGRRRVPPHQSELNEAARRKPQTSWKVERKSMLESASPVVNPPNNKIIVHGKGIFLQMKGCKIRSSGKKPESE
jgi:hypothetical protein